MILFGPLHLALIAAIVVLAAALALVCRKYPSRATLVRMVLGCGLCANELVWWVYRYSHEGLHLWNLPLQLCDMTLWGAVVASLTCWPPIVEFTYFAGLAGAGMAVLTPDLWTPWPSYPAVYFFVAHGGILVSIAVLVFGRIAPLRRGAVWRAYIGLLIYATSLGIFNAISGSNYMYLCVKPRNASLLDALGPWPVYLLPAAAVALGAYWLLWLPVRKQALGAGSKP